MSSMMDWELPFRAFFGHMTNRMTFSGHKYGPVRDSYPTRIDALTCMKQRLNKYHETHNIEWLIDAANFILIEAMCPRYEDAVFHATSSDESPGLATKQGTQWHGAGAKSQVGQFRPPSDE